MECNICRQKAMWTENKAIYGRNYGKSFMIWLCPNRHYVGCHENSQRPKGTFADQETRKARMEAHGVVDPLWKSGAYKRSTVYEQLSHAFGRQIHIGEATKEDCADIIKTAKLIFKDERVRHHLGNR
jgi:hypothetical protein